MIGKGGVLTRKDAVVSIEALNDLTFQFVTISTKVFEIEVELEDLKKVLLELIEKF